MNSKKENTVLNKITEFCKNNSKIIFLGLIVLLNFFILVKSYSDTSCNSQLLLFLSYQDIGFSSRVFLGTILRLFGLSNIRSDIINIILFLTYLTVSALFFWIIVQIFQNNKTYKKRIKQSSEIEPWYIYVCACPIFLYGFSYNLYGSINVFLVLLVLICFLLLQKQKATFLIPILCVLAIFIDHVFALIYLPVICLLLWNKSKKNWNGKYFSALLKTTLVFNTLTTILMTCFSFKSEFPTYHYGTSKIFSVNNFHFLQDLTQGCDGNKLSFDDEILWLLIALPLIVFFAYLWKNCLKASKGQNKKFYKLCFVHLALCLPSIIYFKGFRSWLTSVIICQMLLLFGLLLQSDKTLITVFKEINLVIGKNSITLFGLIYVFYFLISVFLPVVSLR